MQKRLILGVFILVLFGLFPNVQAQTKVVEIPLYEDTYVEEGYPQTPVYNQRNLYVGYDLWYQKKVTRVFVEPDYALMHQHNIVPGKIRKAKLVWYLYQVEDNAPSSYRLVIYKVPNVVDIFNLTWANQPNVAYYYYCDISIGEGVKECSITSLLSQNYESYLSSGASRLFSIRLKNEHSPALIFWSSECIYHPDVCDSNKRPFIRIEYEDNSIPSKPVPTSPTNGAALNVKNVSFHWEVATDPDGDTLFYKIQISKDPNFYTIYKESTWLDSINTWQTAIAQDGKYYWRVKVKDLFGNTNYSNPSSFMLDRTPPDTPIVVSLPPYLNLKEYTIEWYIPNEEENVNFWLEWADNVEFQNAFNSGWITTTKFKVGFKHEGTYYFRVKAKDALGNQSGFSKIVKVVVDWQKPKVQEFSVSKHVFNSARSTSVAIRFKVADLALNRVGVQVYDGLGQKIFEELRPQTDHVYIYWHPPASLREGYYFVYGIADDKVGHVLRSAPAVLLNDKSGPLIALYGPNNNAWINKRCVSFSYAIKDTSFSSASVYLSNRFYRKLTTATGRFNLCLNDGTYSLKIKATDKAANSSWTNSRYINIDTHPPALPHIEVLRLNAQYARLKVKCESGAKLFVYLLGHKLYEGTCTRGQFLKDIPVVWALVYKFIAYQQDKAGNKSKTAEFLYKHKLWAPKKTPGIQSNKVQPGTCWVKYNFTHKKIKQAGCKFKITGTKVYTARVGKTYTNTVAVKVHPYAMVKIDYYKCKPFTFWDIRTWFGCVEEFVTRESKKIRVYYLLDKHNARGKQKGNNIVFTWLTNSSIGKQVYLRFKAVVWLKGMGIVRSCLSKQFNVEVVYVNKRLGPPLAWIFSNTNVLVSQWYGYTKYEHPHTGVDFAVYKRQIYSPADGKIIALGYHKKSACFGGGYYVGIQHLRNLYTFYFHLQNIKGLHKYQKIRAGAPLAVSGNTGRYLCRPLGYHLHFEVRKCVSPWCHMNPVPYLNVDWRKIKTATYGRYWGRLSGQNPHPGY